MVRISCSDLGSSCGFTARADSVDGLIPLIEEHGRKDHGMGPLTPELISRVRDLATVESGSRKL